MFELLKKLKNSHYYYYADIDEDDEQTDEEDNSKKLSQSENSRAEKISDNTLNNRVSSSIGKSTVGSAGVKSLTEAELHQRVAALKAQVELLKKSKKKENDILKSEFYELRREKEAIELQREIDLKQIQYYKNIEAENQLLQQQLVAEGEKASQLQNKIQDSGEEAKRVAALEAELERTKSQLLKRIKNNRSEIVETAVEDQSKSIINRLEEELASSRAELSKSLKHNDILEKQLKEQRANLEKKKQEAQVTSINHDNLDFSSNLKVLYNDLLGTKKEAQLLFDDIMMILTHATD